MNETFNAARLWRLMQYEVVNYIPRCFKALLIFSAPLVALWLIALVSDNFVPAYKREMLIAFLWYIAIVFSPYIVYKDVNDRKRGYLYAMIPASTLEKLLSMLALCTLVVPLLAYAVLTATDLLLYLFSNLGVGSFVGMDLFNPLPDILKILFAEEVAKYEFVALDVYYVVMLVHPILYTMMFNTIFRKNKVLKTILFNVSMVFACVIMVIFVAEYTTEEFWKPLLLPLLEGLGHYIEDVEDLAYFCLIAGRLVSVLLAALFLVVTYFRIKRVNY